LRRNGRGQLDGVGFDARELEICLCGLHAIEVEDWRRHTVVKGNHPGSSSIVRRFWEVVGSWDHELRAALLRFVTGTPALPPEGFSALEGKDGPQPFAIRKWAGRQGATSPGG
jgi:hypothetical protein